MGVEAMFANSVGAVLLVIAFRLVWRLWSERSSLADTAERERKVALSELRVVQQDLLAERVARAALEVEVEFLRNQVTRLENQIAKLAKDKEKET